MALKNTVEVVIAGKVYKLCGFESPEYLHRVAAYVNGKMDELAASDGYKRQNADQRQLLLNMNLADDYFKEKDRAEKLSAEMEKKDKELYSTRHDLIEAQLEIENLKKSAAAVRQDAQAQAQGPDRTPAKQQTASGGRRGQNGPDRQK